MTDFIYYTHTDSSITELSELVSGSNLTSICKGWDIGELLKFSDGYFTNSERILDNYPIEFKNLEETQLDFIGFNLSKISENTILAIPKDKLNREVLVGEGQSIDVRDDEVFMADKLEELLNDPLYIPLDKSNKTGSLPFIKTFPPFLLISLYNSDFPFFTPSSPPNPSK